jgi:hypothetical protein
MTSEILILNKRGVVLAADSAVTTSGVGDGKRPRYAKTANKIFELADSGNVAIAVFAGASIDSVPWELAIKLFRKSLGSRRLPSVAAYTDELLTYLTANPSLFPPDLLERFVVDQFEAATIEVLKLASALQPSIADQAATLIDRTAAWAAASTAIETQLIANGVKSPLTDSALQAVLAEVPAKWVQHLTPRLAAAPDLAAVIDPAQLAALAHRHRYAYPDSLLGYTGVVVTGFGEDEIFAGYRLIHIYGHVGNELFASGDKADKITHAQNSLMVPLAQHSMIDLFTDGFGFSLWAIIKDANQSALAALLADLQGKGIDLTTIDTNALIAEHQQAFMKAWTRKNWDENYLPLMGVLTTLSIEEMAHLAETLLTLQSLKERVTSASEEVGGPIDVAAITKSEGLVWIKRKHYFGTELNQRYLARLSRGIQP